MSVFQPARQIVDSERDWRHRAACAAVDPELFFPVGACDADRIAAAKAVCHRCPVRRTCLEEALNQGHDHGIWGGLTEGERRPLLGQSATRQVVGGEPA